MALEFGFKPDYEYQADTDATVPDLARTGSLALANSGDQVVLYDPAATLPPRLQSAVVVAADNITAIAASEGIELGGKRGEATEYLITILYLMRERCVRVERDPQPYLGDQLITVSEIAAVLETIGQILISDKIYDFANHNPSWFMDAANLLERLAETQR